MADDSKQETTALQFKHKKALNLWSIIKTASALIFGNIDIATCIYKTFQENKWSVIDDILNDLIQFETNNIIHIILKNIKNDGKLCNQWDENRDNKILYQLLLTIYKDSNINIASILNEFIAITPFKSETFDFYDCNTRQLIQILINDIFDANSLNINPISHNIIIQYFVENQINGKNWQNISPTDFANNLLIFIKNQYENTFIHDYKNVEYVSQHTKQIILEYSKYYGSSPLSKDTLVNFANTISYHKTKQVLQCKICYYISTTHYNGTCKHCNSLVFKDARSTNSKLEDAKSDENDIADEIMTFFNQCREKPFDVHVFPKLATLFENNETALNKMRCDNYLKELDKKDYDTILKSFIGWIATIKCENTDCYNKLKLICSCDPSTFQKFTYSVILTLVGLKSGNIDPLRKKLSMENRTIIKIA
eukprot:227275_1